MKKSETELLEKAIEIVKYETQKTSMLRDLCSTRISRIGDLIVQKIEALLIVPQIETIGQLITAAIKKHELNPVIVEKELKLQTGLIDKLMNDNFYTNSVPVKLFLNLIVSLQIPIEKVSAAMLPTLNVLLSKETPKSIQAKPKNFQLWENEESVCEYTVHLKYLYNKQQTPKP